MTDGPTVAVIGAGLTGLTAAYYLRRTLGAGARIIVADSAERVGGKLKTVATATGPIEVGAEAYLAFREDATAFFEQLGLGDELVEPSGLPSSVWSGGQLHAMPRNTVMGIPASPEGLGDLISEHTAARIKAEGDSEQVAPMHWISGDDCNLGQLLRVRLGDELVDHVVSPLLGGVYSTSADDLGMRATVPQIADALDTLANAGAEVSVTAAAGLVLEQRAAANEARLASAETTKPRPVFRTFQGGYQVLLDALIERAAPELLLHTQAGAVTRKAAGFHVEGIGAVDGVVVAAPAPVTGAVLADVAPAASDIIGGVDIANSAVVAMRFDDDSGLPHNSGILVASDAGLDAKAFTFSSRKWPHLQQRGGAIVRASFGRYDDCALVDLPDADLIAKAKADLRTVSGFDVEPAETMVQRWYGGLPRYDVGHMELMDVADQELAEIPGLAAAGAWHRGPGVPACIADAKKAAVSVGKHLGGV
ncbi:protoporphyrinogen oxidase [Corynebacterium sp. TAE3-ERU12]|nr:protoporphyrinogen oxidase [Corynebacterium sp. TAE3-ERU12]MBV7295334.1 protoporphyrinogen oxidase [Corynebacterium sp. TAE3-ERU12]